MVAATALDREADVVISVFGPIAHSVLILRPRRLVPIGGPFNFSAVRILADDVIMSRVALRLGRLLARLLRGRLLFLRHFFFFALLRRGGRIQSVDRADFLAAFFAFFAFLAFFAMLPPFLMMLVYPSCTIKPWLRVFPNMPAYSTPSTLCRPAPSDPQEIDNLHDAAADRGIMGPCVRRKSLSAKCAPAECGRVGLLFGPSM
jgi:hypothetical protein